MCVCVYVLFFMLNSLLPISHENCFACYQRFLLNKSSKNCHFNPENSNVRQGRNEWASTNGGDTVSEISVGVS